MTTTPKVPLGQVILKKTYLINFFKHNMEQAEVSTLHTFHMTENELR